MCGNYANSVMRREYSLICSFIQLCVLLSCWAKTQNVPFLKPPTPFVLVPGCVLVLCSLLQVPYLDTLSELSILFDS